MYEFECLTAEGLSSNIYAQECPPGEGACYPDSDEKCGPDVCDP